jgi:hypothetical protein
MKAYTNSIQQQSHRLRLTVGTNDTIQQTAGGHDIGYLIGTEHLTLPSASPWKPTTYVCTRQATPSSPA